MWVPTNQGQQISTACQLTYSRPPGLSSPYKPMNAVSLPWALQQTVALLTDLTYVLHAAVLLEKLTYSLLVKTFPIFYGTRRFSTAFTRAPPSHFLKIHLKIILPFMLSLSSGLTSSGFPIKPSCSHSESILWLLTSFRNTYPNFWLFQETGQSLNLRNTR